MIDVKEIIETGRECAHRHPSQDMTASEIYYLLDVFNQEADRTDELNALYEVITNAYFLGVGTRHRSRAKGLKRERG